MPNSEISLIDIDKELEEMKKHPIDYSDIPPLTEEQRKSMRFYYQDFLKLLPKDMLKELARRRLEELKHVHETV